MVRTVTSNRKKLDFSFCWWHVREGGPGRTREFELTHGRKMDKPISHVQGWISGQISISVASSYSQIIRGDRICGTLQDQDPDWDPASGLGLAQ